MKKGTTKIKKPLQLIDELSEIAAKKYAAERGVLLKERYKQHKTTAFWAHKHGIEYALNTPELLQYVSDDVLKKAGLIRVIPLNDSRPTIECRLCAGTGKTLQFNGQSTSALYMCHNCNGAGYIFINTATTDTSSQINK